LPLIGEWIPTGCLAGPTQGSYACGNRCSSRYGMKQFRNVLMHSGR
jgi:hypothetical protein